VIEFNCALILVIVHIGPYLKYCKHRWLGTIKSLTLAALCAWTLMFSYGKLKI
jgi:hypothetical protein